MKKMRFLMMAAVASMLVFSACDLEDLDNPVITLTGGDMEVVLNDPAGYVEPGFVANDDKDGDLTANVIVTGTVDATKIGSYEITYSVSDKAGNKASVKRKVDVIVKQANYTGSWAVNEVITGDNPDPNWNYTATIAPSGADLMKLLVTNFGGFAATFVPSVTFDKFGNFVIPNQPMTGSGFTGTIQGTGTTSQNGNTLNITYTVNYSDGDVDNCVGTWTRSK
jgi:hypothetical protein